MDFKGSKTEQNLNEALKGESVARNKYTFYASQAKKDGFEEIARVFEETANNEKEHAKIWFKILHDNKMPSTEENLKDCIKNENYEHTLMYPEFAKIAREEGFNEIGELFERICRVENFHEQRYRKLLENLENKKVFSREETQKWECSNCGYTVESKDAPKVCALCSHPQAFFFIQKNNY